MLRRKKIVGRNDGFALVVALACMALLLLLALSMHLWVKVEAQVATHQVQQLEAREAAKLALFLALGTLQKHAGPDSCVTARADLTEKNVKPERRFWTGAWDTNQAHPAPTWLVSGLNPNPSVADNEVESLLGPTSLEFGGAHTSDPSVSVPSIELPNTWKQTTTRIAWWISDEGVKASIATPPLHHQRQHLLFNSEGTGTSELQVAHSHGLEALFPSYDRFDANDVARQDQIHTVHDLLLLPSFAHAFETHSYQSTEAPEHALTPFSYGVLANTLPANDPASGLLRDLSLFPQLLGDGLQAYLQLGEAHEQQVHDAGASALRLWTPIRGLTDLSSLQEGQIALPITPILSSMMLAFTLTSEAPVSQHPNFVLRARFFCEFWNPFTHTLKMTDSAGNPLDLELEISGLPSVRVSRVGTSLQSKPIDLQALLANPNSEDGSLTIQLINDPEEAWLPGKTKNWVGIERSGPSAHSPYRSVDTRTKQWGHNDNTLDKTNAFNQAAGLDTGEPRFAGKLRHQSDGPHELRIKVFVRSTDARELIADLNGIRYDRVSTRPSGYDNTHAGMTFGYHIILRGPHLANDDPEYYRGRWLYDHDPRNGAPTFYEDWHLNNDRTAKTGSAYYPAVDGLQPLATPSPQALHQKFGNDPNTIDSDRSERLLDRSSGTHPGHNYLDRLWQDAPLFEIPRQRVRSLAALQHIYFHNERPYQVGNSWGAEGQVNTSAWFDRYYFSGFSRFDPLRGFDSSTHLPNPCLQGYGSTDPITVAGWQAATASDQTAALQPANHLLVRNRFNLNSTSVAAWQAVLGSVRLQQWPYVDYPENDSASVDTIGTARANRGFTFTRFPHSLQETYKAPATPTFDGFAPVAPSAFYRHGARRLSHKQLHSLASEIVSLLKDRGQPFTSMEAFLSAESSGKSLLEQAIANTFAPEGRQVWHHDWELNGDANALLGPGSEVDHFSPGFLTQADVLTAIGPMLATRSDTFKIRVASRSFTKLGHEHGRAALEATVQRVPEFVHSEASQQRLGRRFKLLSLRWIEPLKR
jgi:hypothetical protein